MKKYIFLLLMLFSILTNATTYYVSTQVEFNLINSRSYSAGDQILLERGKTFSGNITISQAGSVGNPIIIGAYGTGANPIITGFTNVTAWTNLGSNIWESTNAVSTLSTCEMVTINGVNTAKGRFPNYSNSDSDWLFFQSHSGTTSITSSSLTGTPDWTGAEAVIKARLYRLHRSKITSQTGSTLVFNAIPNAPDQDNMGFFIQDDVRTLDVQNEWYYNPTTHKIRVYSTSQPVNVKVASVDYLIVNNPANITIENLTLIGSNHTAIYSDVRGNNKIIRNCNVSFCGVSGIQIVGWHSNVSDCSIDNCNNFGIDQQDNNKYCLIHGCAIRNIGTIVGMGIAGGYIGINSGGDFNHALTIENNTILNCGFNGTSLMGDSIIVKNNYVDNFCNILCDGGGIYISNAARPNANQIIGNIVLNGGVTGSANYGTPEAESPSVYPQYFPVQAMGIYCDILTDNYKIYNNTTAFCERGILTASIADVDIQYNTVYNTFHESLSLAGGIYNGNTNNKVKNNIFVQNKATRRLALLITNSATDDTPAMANYDYNIYARPLYDYTTIQWEDQKPFYSKVMGTTPRGQFYKTLEEWKIFSSQDSNSKKSPVAVVSESDIQFEYNATNASKTIPLTNPSVTIQGVKVVGYVTIPAYSSAVYLKDPNPTPAPPTGNRHPVKSGTKYFISNGHIYTL